MSKKQLLLFGGFILFLIVAFLFSPAGGEGFQSNPMKQAERAVFAYEIPLTSAPHGEDYVIEWQDPGIEAAVRHLLEKPEGDILHSDIWDIQILNLSCNSADDTGYIKTNTSTDSVTYDLSEDTLRIVNLRDLVHFDSLHRLNLFASEELSACTGPLVLDFGLIDPDSLDLVRPLESLEQLGLYNFESLDLAPLADLQNLKTLILDGSSVRSLETLAQLPMLKNLKLENGTMFPSLEPLAETKLEYLSLNCEQLRVGTEVYDHLDYTPLTQIPTLIYLDLANHRTVDGALCTAILESAPKLSYLRVDRTPAARELPEPDGLIYYGNAY